MTDITPLFSPLQIKNKTFRNRIVMPPMVVNRGPADPAGYAWYGQHAAAGSALVIVESTDVVRFGVDLTVENLSALAGAIHRGGALAGIQLFPGVRGQRIAPADVSVDDIHRLLDQYRLAAEMCAAAGFDALEPHGAHNYLLNRFFSPELNQRADEYGVTLEGRMRFPLQVMDALRPAAHKAGMLLLYRHSPGVAGASLTENLAFIQELIKAGLDILDISPGGDQYPGDRSFPFMSQGIPVIAVRQMGRVDRALETLAECRATLVAVGRAQIADPEWVTKVRQERFDEIVECTYCDECHRDLREGRLVGCPLWTEQAR